VCRHVDTCADTCADTRAYTGADTCVDTCTDTRADACQQPRLGARGVDLPQLLPLQLEDEGVDVVEVRGEALRVGRGEVAVAPRAVAVQVACEKKLFIENQFFTLFIRLKG
jgi:hypothetical protein